MNMARTRSPLPIEVTCNRCGWVHMGVTREYVKSWQAVDYDYEKCFRCGNSYTDFRPALPDDCPIGSTIQPIIVEPTAESTAEHGVTGGQQGENNSAP